jgi:peptidoglycan/LPS O-acetylase OafA/YrhL
MFVVVYHFSPFLMGLKTVYDLGSLIVFFFVLSSYLLTRIMLDDKQEARETGKPLRKVALTFLTRRTFRIFPAYYLYLIILMLFPLEGMDLRQHPVVYFGYIYNVWIYITQHWGPYAVHLWTLAVEEQFYLLWPWIILFTPTRHLPKIFGLMILTGIAFRVLFMMYAPQANFFPVLVLTPACLDSFAAGALLAYLHYRRINISQWLKWGAILALPVWIFLICTKHQRIFTGLDRSFVSFYTVVVIHVANRGFKGFMKKFLENGWVQHLSKISYGIYLYHLITALFFWKIYAVVHRALAERGYEFKAITYLLESRYVDFCIYFAMAVLCANISWYRVEQPFNRLRNYLTRKIS